MGKGLIPNSIAVSGVLYAGSGWLRKAVLTTAAIGEGIIYDNATTDAGTCLLRYTVPAAVATESWPVDFPGAGVKFENGLYGICSGGISSIVTYRDE